MSMKNLNDTIGNRTRDLPACSAVPQPTAPLCYCRLLAFVSILIVAVFLLLGQCNNRMWFIDCLIDRFTDWSDSGLLSSPRYYFSSPSPSLHTFILLSLLNFPSYLLFSGSIYFLFTSLFWSHLFSLRLSLLFSVHFHTILFSVPFYSLLNSPILSLLFRSFLSRLVSSVPFCFLLFSFLFSLCCSILFFPLFCPLFPSILYYLVSSFGLFSLQLFTFSWFKCVTFTVVPRGMWRRVVYWKCSAIQRYLHYFSWWWRR